MLLKEHRVIPISLGTYNDVTLGTQQSVGPQELKVLGMRWNPQTDHLIFSVSDIARAAQTVEPTKRNVVSIVGKFYYPLGYLTPVVLNFKVLFQKLCVNKMNWDQLLTDSLLEERNSLVQDLHTNAPISIPRCYLHGVGTTLTSITLTGFCDASTRAYAAVVYLVVEADGDVKVQFVVSKEITIPRLELLSALLLSRLMTVVSPSLKPLLPPFDTKCYTDSNVALYWFRGTDKDWKPFVNNRIAEIRTHVSPEHWNHPADLPSRGLSLLELSLSQLWRQGPPWLQEQNTLTTESNLKVWKFQFDLFADDRGLIRCRGRLKNADLPYSLKYTLFLPRRSHLTTLIVRMAHVHNGVCNLSSDEFSKMFRALDQPLKDAAPPGGLLRIE